MSEPLKNKKRGCNRKHGKAKHYAYPVELVNKNLTEAQPGYLRFEHPFLSPIRQATSIFFTPKTLVMDTIRPKKVQDSRLFQGKLPHK